MGIVVNVIKNEPNLNQNLISDAILNENKLKFENVSVESSSVK